MTFFFYGPNEYVMRERVNEMVAAYVAKNGSNMGVERLDGTVSKPHDIRAALQAAPFLASSRLVIISGLVSAKATLEKLGDVLLLVPKTTVAVFVDPAADQRTSAFKRFLGADKVVHFETLTIGQLTLWARKQIEGAGGMCGPGVAQELVKAAGDDQWRLAAEIAKLVAYDRNVTVETVRLMVVQSVEQNVFELTDAMLDGRMTLAMPALANLLQAQQNELGLLALIQGQLRNVLYAKAAGPLSAQELAKAAGIKPYPAEKAQAIARRLSEDAVKQAFSMSVRTEHDIKSGVSKPDIALEMLIFRVCELITARRQAS